MLRIKPVFLVMLILLLPLTAFGQLTGVGNDSSDKAQAEELAGGTAETGMPVAVLEYFDDPFEVQIFDSEGFEVYADYGVELQPGSRIETKNSTAELRLYPNGSIIKLSPDTQFTIDALQGRDNSDMNRFQMAAGKIRAVAAKAAGGEQRYTIETPAAVCGVRGTDFGLEAFEGSTDSAFVKEGLIEFTQKGSGKSLQLGAGQFADAVSADFSPVSLSSDQMSELFSSLDFKGEDMDPESVPGKGTPVSQTDEEAADEEAADEEAADEEAADEEAADEDVAGNDAAGTNTASADESGESGQDSAPAADAQAGFLGGLGEFLGMELGTVTINDQVYSKLILQPYIQAGKLSMALYLPVIYSSNLFSMDDWYKPAGNNEWSFGSDQGDVLTATSDFVRDLALKFRFVQYGDPDMDNFFFGIGNLSTMTIGHGMLMRNYANDADFPATRKLGLNFRLTSTRTGIEAVTDDLTDIDIVGGRVFLRPFAGKDIMNFGLSSVVDLSPAGDLEDPVSYGDPIFVTTAADLELFKINSDIFSLLSFVDAGTMIPYFRKAVPNGAGEVAAGFKSQVLFDGSRINNFGIVGGFRGNLFLLDWSLEYRYYKGFFSPAFFGPNYDRMRGEYLQDTLTYLKDTSNSDYNNVTMGIFGSGGFSLFEAIHFNAGYFWPWGFDSAGDFEISYDDHLQLTLALEKGLLPIDIEGAITYEKSSFAETLIKEDKPLTLFDSETMFKGEVVYPLSSALNLAFVLSTAVARDGEGEIIYQSDGITPQIVPTVNIESRISF